MTEHGPIGPEEVEAFYGRQRAEILRRLPAGDRLHLPGRKPVGLPARLAGLAAAALVVLSVVAVFQQPGPMAPAAWPEALVEEGTLAATDLPLPAYGDWDLATVSDESEAELAEQAGPTSLDWLLGESTVSAGSLPGFLEAYGTWVETEDADAAATTT